MDTAGQALTLYQFELCPYCHKVKAALDVKGLPYQKVEVNPYTKRELPPLPEGAPKKVPVLALDGAVVADSTDILEFLETRFGDRNGLLPADEAGRERTREIEAWVDDKLTQILPAVIYGTWGEAIRAAQVTARSSNFGMVQNLMVRAGGSLIMHQVSKRIVKRLGGGDPHEMLATELDKLEEWLGDQAFVCGEQISVGDVAAHGALTCIADFPAFERIMKRPVIATWYKRVADLRDANRAR
ncbi:MAG: microsomal prostaglandin-E synthase 2 [Hyphomicrobiaceae bacterium]|jgi:microsomal prostaglandin-E synthase 2